MNTLGGLALRSLTLSTALAAASAAEVQVAPASPDPAPNALPGLPVARGERIELSSCAGGPGITVGLADARAVLADDERGALLEEIKLRYPALADDGFEAAVMLLWQKTPREWLYVSLQPRAASGGMLCFTASFVAQQFRVTPAVMKTHALVRD